MAMRSAAGPAWPTPASTTWDCFQRYRAGYAIDVKADASIRGSRSGELVARCIVETGTSSYYTALAEGSAEPVLQQVCRLIAADEYRHFKLFYDHLKRYLERESLSHMQRLRVALGRATESEDDELAFAFHVLQRAGRARPTTTSAASPATWPAPWASTGSAILDRSMGMIFKAVGLSPRGRVSHLAARAAFRFVQWRQARYARAMEQFQAPLAKARLEPQGGPGAGRRPARLFPGA